ncbi:AraC family transcriptional regulator [Vallitalea longa]|uniref:AraC family transcriptional regulator n=1 Tax=Vallitalea longa TaxID=2936439 RepID=A0A9W5YI07_9FIRM|nr:AraC family transcriptional regulator [Vallitalea longa]GKX31618.1 AraC family transcriptional regulator [Vallitalea longa]
MEWIKSLNSAIDYIEENIFSDISCKDISEHIYSSSFHFQRVFSLLTGITVGEYIRNRRLSMAGQELTMSSSKVIDIALKYGYNTPESFSKAFSRFHGITPKQAKSEGSNLKSFNRLIIKIQLEGGNIMDYKIVKREEYKILAKTRYFTSENSTVEIPKFWSDYYSEGSNEIVCGMLGICEQEKCGCKEYRYGIGCECSDDADIPNGFEKLTIPEYTWAVFKCVGPMPDTIQNVWKRIYSEWLPQSEYELIPDYDIELYTDGDNKSKDYVSEIWIPVKKK